MGTPVLIGSAAAVLLALAGVVVLVLRALARSRHRLDAAARESADLRERLDALAEQLAEQQDRQRHALAATDQGNGTAYVITDAGDVRPEPTVPDRVVLSATLGEPLVRAVSFGHGVRRAMSAESRNRIWFEMRREVRRARKQRRREMKDAWRRLQAEERAEHRPDERVREGATVPGPGSGSATGSASGSASAA